MPSWRIDPVRCCGEFWRWGKVKHLGVLCRVIVKPKVSDLKGPLLILEYNFAPPSPPSVYGTHVYRTGKEFA